MKNKAGFLAMGILSACFSTAAVAQEQSTYTVDEASKIIEQAGKSAPLVITSKTASTDDKVLKKEVVGVMSMSTCGPNGQGIQRYIFAAASATDITREQKDVKAILGQAAMQFEDTSTALFLTPAPEDQKPADIKPEDWNTVYHVGQFADTFEKTTGVTLTLFKVDVPNPNMYCNVPFKPK